MLFRDVIALHCLSKTEHTHTVGWQHADINVTACVCNYLCVVVGAVQHRSEF